MNKQEFLDRLGKALSGVSRQDRAERLTFYSEMIDDRMEEGLSEEEAVAAVGSADEIAAQVLAENPPAKEKKKRSVGTIVLLILGSPVWLSLGIAAVAVAISLYASLWAVLVSLWAAFGAVAGSALGGAAAGALLICRGEYFPGVAMIGAGMLCAGLAIFLFFGCKAVTKGAVSLTKKTVLGAKRRICNG